jgi:hypothetical protein
MMQASRNNKNKTPKFMDMKLFIAALTLAITIGLWNLLSNKLVQADKLAPTAVVNLPAQPPAGVAQDLPPIPTLVSVLQIDTSKISAIAPANSVQPVSSSVQSAPLRSVAIPTQTFVQQNAPIVQQAVVNVSGGGSGGGGGGHHAATHSSHK